MGAKWSQEMIEDVLGCSENLDCDHGGCFETREIRVAQRVRQHERKAHVSSITPVQLFSYGRDAGFDAER